MSSVISFSNQEPKIALVKGSPEIMKTLFLPETVPPNYDSLLYSLTLKGLRVLAAGIKEISNSSYS
jgi:magnesium-transporting ATPase (P-type)